MIRVARDGVINIHQNSKVSTSIDYMHSLESLKHTSSTNYSCTQKKKTQGSHVHSQKAHTIGMEIIQ